MPLSLMISQHWFAVRHQAITRANVDPDLCHHMASLGHNELTAVMTYFLNAMTFPGNNELMLLLKKGFVSNLIWLIPQGYFETFDLTNSPSIQDFQTMPHPMKWYVREKIKVRLLRIHSGIKRRVYACYSSLVITLQNSVPSSQGWYFKIKCRTRIKTLGNESGYELSKETLCTIF